MGIYVVCPCCGDEVQTIFLIAEPCENCGIKVCLDCRDSMDGCPLCAGHKSGTQEGEE